VSRYQKGITNLHLTEARDSEWQWHQLGHMQVCTSLQTDNHTSTPRGKQKQVCVDRRLSDHRITPPALHSAPAADGGEHREAEKRNQFSLACIFLVPDRNCRILFTFTGPKESRSISYNSVYLTLARVENFAATVTLNILCFPVTDDYRLVFTVSISLLRKTFNACQNLLYRIVAYTFLNTCEKKIHQFLSNIKREAHKRKSVSFFCLTVYTCICLRSK